MDMKIGVVQTRPVKGNVEANLADHLRWAGLAIGRGVDLLVFPELSISGYEPELARELATTREDERFASLQRMSDKYGIFIGAGMPVWGDGAKTAAERETRKRESGDEGEGPSIGMIIFQPNEPRLLYAKQYLHADEIPYFTPGAEQVFLWMDDHKIALSICYELSVPEHSVNAYSHRADIYLASVAKTAEGVDKALETLEGIASVYSMTVLMANCVGHCDNFDCGGRSAVLNNKGEKVAVMGGMEEGMLVYDTANGEVHVVQI